MASLPVNNNLNVLAAIANQTTQTAGMPDSRKDGADDSFGMVMSRVNLQSENQSGAQTVTVSATAKGAMNTTVMSTGVTQAGMVKESQGAAKNTVEAKNSGNDAAKKADDKTVEGDDGGKAVEDNKTVDKASDSKVTDEQKEAMDEAGEKLVEEVAKEMEVTPEEVEEAMTVLGLSAFQLLDPDNMKQLLVEISGNEDHLSILTDGELYGHLQNLLEEVSITLEDLQTELGLTQEELNTLIADMAVVESEMVDTEEVPQNIQTQDALANVDGKTDELEPDRLDGSKDYTVTVHKDGETVKVKVAVDDATGEENSKEEVTAKAEIQSGTENRQSGRETQGQDKGEGNASNMLPQTPIEQPIMSELQEQPLVERYIDVDDIMNQIGEYIKLNLKADVQELELQLHPASLGNVNIQLTAKDGIITAQFTTQNEAVKSAIESQLVQLRTQFDEQGLKVDAVEVAVADYRFNQNFAGNEEKSDEGAAAKKNRRKINLNELNMEELPEDMEDDERLAAQMMAQNGSTVDYTA
ncbi:MAG: flagellar hook-length control protein FliK [Clostridiales bacterium]|nr:flagellar hook-length control protein FliK [Clostridiales bacterium]